MALDAQVCLVGEIARRDDVLKALKKMKMPYVSSETGKEFLKDRSCETVHVVDDFESYEFTDLHVNGARILGPPIILKKAEEDEALPCCNRPLFCQQMTTIVVCFTGFTRKEQLKRLGELVHHMGGSIRKDMTSSVTHLVANSTSGQKYRYAVSLGKPIVKRDWVEHIWERRADLGHLGSDEELITRYKVAPFFNLVLSFHGFTEDEKKHMEDQTTSQGGSFSPVGDPTCTHLVIDENVIKELTTDICCPRIVKQEWFWASIQIDACADEHIYKFEMAKTPRAFKMTPTSIHSGRKRRLKDSIAALSQTADQQDTPLPPRKRRSSARDAMSVSCSSILDATQTPDNTFFAETPELSTPSRTAQDVSLMQTSIMPTSKRHMTAMELLQTETNYVKILETILTVFKEPLEQEQTGGPILAKGDIKTIFSKIPDICAVHQRLKVDLEELLRNFSEEKSIGAIIVKHANDMREAYPPFVNYFEMTKSTIQKCDKELPRFHAFLKICQSKPECGRQGLTELLIRPVQRLPSMILLLSDLFKRTDTSHPDHKHLEKALESLKGVAEHINEDRRKAECRTQLFDIINDIEGVPADLLSAHRTFIQRIEAIELADSHTGKGDNFTEKGSSVSMILFSDTLEICKKRSKYASSHKSPHTTTKPSQKTHKHIELLPLSHIRRVLDVNETETCHSAFALLCKPLMESSSRLDRLYMFALTIGNEAKADWLKTLCHHIATATCKTDVDNFLCTIDPEELEITKTNYEQGTINKAVRAAKKATKKVGRTFSFNKTPRRSVNRAVSSVSTVFSPIVTGDKITPQQLGRINKRLGSTMTLKALSPMRRQPLAPKQLRSLTLGPSTTKKL
ncbi:protein ECT2-like isoform X2 [Apostichopus japonicus]